MSENRILFEYISNKMLDYEEPQRKGTPKGDRIGFPRNKYFASLWVSLTNCSLKKLADDLGPKHDIKYGVLRHWNREKDFQEMARSHALEFAIHLIQHVANKLDDNRQEFSDYYDCKTDVKPGHIEFNGIYIDAQLFSVAVINAVSLLAANKLESAYDHFKKGDIDTDQMLNELVISRCLNEIICYAQGDKYPENKKFMAYFGKVCIGVIKSTIAAKLILTEREQRLIIDMLENMEEFLTEVAGDKPKKDK